MANPRDGSSRHVYNSEEYGADLDSDIRESVHEDDAIPKTTIKTAVKEFKKEIERYYSAEKLNIDESIVETLKVDSDTICTINDENIIHDAVLSIGEKKLNILQKLLKQRNYEEICQHLLKSPAQSIGVKGGSVMEGELVLSVAALKLSHQKVKILLRLGADAYLVNSHGDNVIHSLVKFAAYNPDKVVEIKEMLDLIYSFVANTKHLNVRELYTMKNKDGRSPLQLAIVWNVCDLCLHLLSLKNVYLLDETHDTCKYEKKIYDITELDSLCNRIVQTKDKHTCVENKDTCVKKKASSSDSVLEVLFYNSTDNDTALKVVQHEIIAYILQLKWRSYSSIFLAWMFLHLTMMVILTAYSIVRVDVFFFNDSRVVPMELNGDTENDFVVVAYWLIPAFGLTFVVPSGFLIFTKTLAQPHAVRKCFHNIDYMTMHFLFVVCIYLDFILLAADNRKYNGEALVISVLCGWLFSTIFLRAIAKCGQLIYLVRRVIIKDILGFILVFIVLLIAFATCLHDLIKYKEDENGNHVPVENFRTFGRTIFTMFYVMLGLIDIDEVFDARSNWLAVILLILFLIITYALLVNALIGIITSTSDEIFAQKQGNMSVHRLSVLVFMEEFFLLRHFKEPIGTKVDDHTFELEIISEINVISDGFKTTTKDKEEDVRLRNIINDALHIREAITHKYICEKCKRREIVLAGNDNASCYSLRFVQMSEIDENDMVIPSM